MSSTMGTSGRGGNAPGPRLARSPGAGPRPRPAGARRSAGTAPRRAWKPGRATPNLRCGSPMSSYPFSPASELARVIADLFTTTLVLLGLVLAVVVFLVAWALARYRSRAAGEPSQRPPPRWPEYAWTAGPVALVVLLFVLSASGARRADPAPGDRAPDLVIVGHQWWWEFRVTGAGVVTANELHLPVGRRLLAQVES